MKSSTFKRVLAIGLLMAGVAQHEAHGMAAKLGKYAAKVAQYVARKKTIAAAGLATAYGCHKAAGPIELFQIKTDHFDEPPRYDGSGNHINVLVKRDLIATTLKETKLKDTGETHVERQNRYYKAIWLDTYDRYNAKSGKRLEPINRAWVQDRDAYCGIPIFQRLATRTIKHPNDKNQIIKYDHYYKNGHFWSVKIKKPSFAQRIKHWASLAATSIWNGLRPFWTQKSERAAEFAQTVRNTFSSSKTSLVKTPTCAITAEKTQAVVQPQQPALPQTK